MKSLSLSLVMALTGATSSIAGTTVWSYDKGKGEMPPAYWYSYGDESTNTTGVRIITEEGYQQFTATLNLNIDGTSAAGFGFTWKQQNKQDAPVDLSAYSGLCLTYKAKYPFRVDFKQSSVTDYNFHGIVLSSQEEFKPKFIDFQNLAQEQGWGTKVDLDLTQQLSVQVNYKTSIAQNLGSDVADRNVNVVTIAAVSLGECETVVEPGIKVLEPYDKEQVVSIKDTDSLKIDLTKVFAVSGNDDVLVATSMSKSVLTMVKPVGSPTLEDELVFTSKNIDAEDSLSLTIIAVGGGRSAMAVFRVKISDAGENPVGPNCPGDPDCPDDPVSENHPTKVLAPYDEAVMKEMLETDTLKVPLGDLFADEDNDKLVFAVNMSAPLVNVLTPLENATLNDTLLIVPTGIKKDTSIVVAIFATDKKSDLVKVQYVLSIKDMNRPPVARDGKYEVDEDEELIVPFNRGLKTLGFDPDGDDFIVVPVDSTKHGILTSFDQMGAFVYSPEKDFYGNDTLTYVLIETANHTMISNKAIVVITVNPVNDVPVVVVADSAFLKDTLRLDMDFDEDTVSQIKIPRKSLTFTDVEVSAGTQELTYNAIGEKIIAIVDSSNASFHYISLKPEASANGLAKVFFYASDGVDSAGVTLYVNLVSPKDIAYAEKDAYLAFNDSTLVVSAKEGVLANDTYPEGVTKGMTAVLAQKPSHGTLVLKEDGSFTYKPEEGYEGVDYFGYYNVVNGTKSKAAIVTITVEKRNLLPIVVVNPATLDTTVIEDFPTSRALKYTSSIIASWFKDPEGDLLTYSAKSKEGKLDVQITDKGILEINSMPDSTGKAYVVVTATDKKSGSKSFEFCVTISPVNDKPILLHADTAYVARSNWKVSWDLDTLVRDVDGDELTFTPNETSALSKYVDISIKGSLLTLSSIDGLTYKDAQKFGIGVKASDPGMLSVTIPLYIIVGTRPAGLQPQLAQPKNNWQNAITAKRGNVTIMDMQGRKVWSAKLPVNPAEVLNASAQVQGRKILRVNNQTWTIR